MGRRGQHLDFPSGKGVVRGRRGAQVGSSCNPPCLICVGWGETERREDASISSESVLFLRPSSGDACREPDGDGPRELLRDANADWTCVVVLKQEM